MAITSCPLCKVPLKTLPQENGLRQIWTIICPCCGTYGASGEVLEDQDGLPGLDQSSRATLAAYVVEKALNDKKAILCHATPTSPARERNEIPISFKDVIREFPLLPITERFDRVLWNLSRAIPLAERGNLGQHHIGLLHAENVKVALFILEALLRKGFLNGDMHLPANFQITADGWARIEEINRGLFGKDNRQAFVAMWFDSSMKAAFLEGISPAIKDAGFEPFRVDKKEFNNQITDEIVAGIRRSKFMVADITGNRSAVYYEAGLMHGLGRPVIFTCKEDHFKDASFDTNHYPHIQWKTTNDLHEKLLSRIQATIVD